MENWQTQISQTVKSNFFLIFFLEWILYKKLGELMPKLKNRVVKHRTDQVKIKPGVGYGGKKVKKIKGGKKRRR